MWINQYHRAELPPGMDNSAFGNAAIVTSLGNPSAFFHGTRTIIREPNAVYPASTVFDEAGISSDVPRYLKQCDASFESVFSSPTNVINFTPDHALVNKHGKDYYIVEESLWHSELFFSKYWRVDHSTDWIWRVDPSWPTPELFSPLVNYCYHRYYFQYFHWIVDVISKVWLLKTQSPFDRPNFWAVGPLDKSFHLPILDLFDIKYEDCVFFPKDIVLNLERAVIPAFSFNESLLARRPNFREGNWNAGWSDKFLGDLRERALNRHGGRGQGNELLYLVRGDNEHRRVVNDSAVREILEPLGFKIINPGLLPFGEQVAAFSEAKVIIAVHGAGLTNLIWAPPGCSILEFAPDGLWDIGYRFLSNMSQHKHNVILCRPFPHPSGIAYGDIEVNLGALRAALENIM